jgi:hypothetical protein
LLVWLPLRVVVSVQGPERGRTSGPASEAVPLESITSANK